MAIKTLKIKPLKPSGTFNKTIVGRKNQRIIDLFHKPLPVNKLFNVLYLLNYFYGVYY
jgi:hypothetical protein